jgi:hypothetical protein
MRDIKLENILVVREYADVFSDDFPDLLPNRDIEFITELQLAPHPYQKDRTECHQKNWPNWKSNY